MDFITQDDLDKITEYAGEEPTEEMDAELKAIYNKLGYLCQELEKKGFETEIRRDPRSRSGPGRFVYQEYQWARVFPPGFRDACSGKFAYIIGLNHVLEFHMKGLREYEHWDASVQASNESNTPIDLEGSSYERVVEQFVDFDRQYRPLFIKTATELGINELLPIKHAMKNEEILRLLENAKQLILQGPPGTGKTRLAKELAATMTTAENIELIQFHPAYTYEDFVRGITAKSNGAQVEYKTENRIFGALAKRANKNFVDHGRPPQQVSKENWLAAEFKQFADTINEALDEEGEYPLNKSVSIIEVEEDAFRYTGKARAWRSQRRMKFADILLAYDKNAQDRQDIKAIPTISGRAWQHATYDFLVLQQFRAFLVNRPPYKEGGAPVTLQKYVLIIDEINRANLPAVLGELIYALEYRGDAVESMYEIDGDRSLTIPPNLYIIGTMNTADRSIGHLDYAIKRRFPAVDVEPSAEVISGVVPEGLRDKAVALFGQTARLFTNEYLSPGFTAAQMQPGHSYFLAATEEELRLKLEYSLKPLLREYLKDGVFRQDRNAEGQNTVGNLISQLSF